jgi:predicted RNase H-like nuclease (RuvC/YqgF family)
MRRYDVEIGLTPEAVEKLRRMIHEYEEKIAELEAENLQLRDIVTNIQDQLGELKNRVREIMGRYSALTL